MYYTDKLETLKDIFGRADLALEADAVRVGDRRYPIVHDVIILSAPEQYTDFVRRALRTDLPASPRSDADFAEDIQFTFGAQWTQYDQIGRIEEKQFSQYYDIVDADEILSGARVCDLGCGSGRASYFLKDLCKDILLVDFSDAVFVARKNLHDADNCLFFMCDLKAIPFKDDFADFVSCLGVLHHLPTPCLDEVRRLRRYAPTLLVYLYYALDNRPVFFRLLLWVVTLVRMVLCRVRSKAFRSVFSAAVAMFVYKPLVVLGRLLEPLGLGAYIPLHDWFRDVSMVRMRQNVNDRFFTRIEQRVRRADILKLMDTFASVTVSENLPYWHFMCRRD